MKYVLFIVLSFLVFCREQSGQQVQLPESGVWINYKYPVYLRDMRSARYVQTQIDITAVEIKSGDSRVWVQFRLRDWQPYNTVFLGDRKWMLCKDSSDIEIPLELMRNDRSLIVGPDMFNSTTQGNVLDAAYHFYAGQYGNGVWFNEDGTITGLDSFIAFKPVIDYSEEPGTGDRIYLRSNTGAWTKFGLYVAHSGIVGLDIYKLRKDELGPKIYHLEKASDIIPLY